MTNKLVYFGDPMCSWCYGFGPEIRNVIRKMPSLEFELILGGLRPYGTEKILGMKNFLLKHWMKIESTTGQKFSYEILDDPNFVYDTEPSNRAIVLAKHLGFEDALGFYEAVQYAFYAEGKNVLSKSTFVDIAKSLDIDEVKYEELFDSEEIKAATRESFSYTIECGVNAFPTLVLDTGDRKHLISRGYQKSEALLEKINQFI